NGEGLVPVFTMASYAGTGGNDFIVSNATIDTTITGMGGADIIIGSDNNETILIRNGDTLRFIDGGNGHDTLRFAGQLEAFDFTTSNATLLNMEEFLFTNNNGGNTVTLDLESVFAMTTAGDHTLNLVGTAGINDINVVT